MSDRLALGVRHQVTLEPPSTAGWSSRPSTRTATPCPPGDGAAEALLALLRRRDDLADRWQVLRLAALPDVSGERPITVDQTNTSVVVGEPRDRQVAAGRSPTSPSRRWPPWPSSARSVSTRCPRRTPC